MDYGDVINFPDAGYKNMRGSGTYINGFNVPATISPSSTNKIINLNSFVAGAAWSDDILLTINGYYLDVQIQTYSVALNMTYRTPVILSWTGLDKIEFIPSGSGYLDTGIDNLCITIQNDTSDLHSFLAFSSNFIFYFISVPSCALDATLITFDDIDNATGTLLGYPTDYHGLTWAGMNYGNAMNYPDAGYKNMRGSGTYINGFNVPATITPAVANKTISLNSFVAGAAWSNDILLTINGYYLDVQIETYSVALNMTYRTPVILSWTGLDKIELIPSGSGYLDTGIDNFCVSIVG